MKITAETADIIKREMAGLAGQAARAKAAILAKELGVTTSTVYYHSKDVRPKRKERADKGKIKAAPEAAIETMTYFTVKHDFSADHVTQVAAANGLAELHPATYNRILRRRKLNRRHLKTAVAPWQSWGASAPNEIHQIDTTVSQQFYLEDDGSIGYESSLTHNKNKPGNKKPRLTLFALVDDFSRAKFAMFVSGNHTIAWMNALFQAWRQKDDPAGFPLHGLPKFLYSDNDSVIKSSKFRHAMETLGVRIIRHEVGRSQAKGKVENSFKIHQEFEKVTKIKAWQSLDAANAALWDYLYYINNRRHSATGELPFARWLRIQKSQLRAAPNEELFRLLHMDADRRRINPDLTLNLNGKKFQLPFRPPFVNHTGETVELFWYPHDISLIYVVLDGKTYEVQYADKILRGVGQAKEELPVPEWLQRKRTAEAQDDPNLRLTGIYKERHRRVYLSPEAQPFQESRIDQTAIGGPMRTKAWFIQQLARGFHFTPPVDDQVKIFIAGIFGDAAEKPENDLLEVLRQLEAGTRRIYPKQAGNATA